MKIFETIFSEQELKPVVEVLKKGQLGFGENVIKLEERFFNFSKLKYNTAVNSASAAAFVIFEFLKEKYGICDVYTTTLGFVSPVWAAQKAGHNIIFVDVGNDLLFDCEDYKSKRNDSNSKNKVILMPVLYGGVSKINNWSVYKDEIIVTDSAHCVTPTIKSDYVFFSFPPYKPICTSDGGMISTGDREADKYFKSYRNFGRASSDNSYNIIQNGFKFYMNNLNAAIGLISLDKYENSLNVRKSNFNFIEKNVIVKNKLLNHDQYSSYYFATVFCENADDKMKKLNITRHYPLLHKTTFFDEDQTLKNSENLYDKFCNIPIHENLTKSDITFVVDTINE